MAFFERFVSRRYLIAREKRALASVITFISISGVTIGVAALIIVLGVIDGIDRDIISKIVEIYPHLKITDADGKGISDSDSVLESVRALEEVDLAEAIVNKQVLFEYTDGDGRTAMAPGRLIGVERLGPGNLYDIPAEIKKSLKLIFCSDVTDVLRKALQSPASKKKDVKKKSSKNKSSRKKSPTKRKSAARKK